LFGFPEKQFHEEQPNPNRRRAPYYKHRD
jgi:hypothetical protein